jgi:hypothetical protein
MHVFYFTNILTPLLFLSFLLLLPIESFGILKVVRTHLDCFSKMNFYPPGQFIPVGKYIYSQKWSPSSAICILSEGQGFSSSPYSLIGRVKCSKRQLLIPCASVWAWKQLIFPGSHHGSCNIPGTFVWSDYSIYVLPSEVGKHPCAADGNPDVQRNLEIFSWLYHQ